MRAGGKQHLRNFKAGRLSQVVRVGLEGQAKEADHPSLKSLQAFSEFVDRKHSLIAIDVHDCVQELGVVVETLRQRRQGLDVLRKARAAITDACVEEARPDPLVEAHAFGNEGGIRIDPLTDSCDLVDERDSRGQERVGRVFDHFRGVDVRRDQDRRLQAFIEQPHLLRRSAVVAADDHPVGVHEVLDG